MIVDEIFAEVHTDDTGNYLKFCVDNTPFYIHESVIPGGIAGADSMYKSLAALQKHDLLERMMTPADYGGLEAQINPGEDIGFISDNQGLFQCFSFDEETSVWRSDILNINAPRGVIKINIYADTPACMQERAISIEFEVCYPLVAQFMSKAHPEPWVYEFLSELDGKTDALEVTHIYRKYKRDGDYTWIIGLPTFNGGLARPQKSDFIHRIVECEALPFISSGHELITRAHHCQVGSESVERWLDDHKSLIPEIGHEKRFGHDLGL